MTWGPGPARCQTTLYFRLYVYALNSLFLPWKISLGGISFPSSEGSGCGPGPGSPGQEQVATRRTRSKARRRPAGWRAGRQGAAGLRDQHQVGPAEARLGTADRSELPQTHREGPGAPGELGSAPGGDRERRGSDISLRGLLPGPQPHQPRPSRKGLRKTRGARGRHVPAPKSPSCSPHPQVCPRPICLTSPPSLLSRHYTKPQQRLQFPSDPHTLACSSCPVCWERNHFTHPPEPGSGNIFPEGFSIPRVRYLLCAPSPPCDSRMA